MRTHRNCREKPHLNLGRVKKLCREMRVPCGNTVKGAAQIFRQRNAWWEPERAVKIAG